jgi:hypothetical protein
MTTPRTIRTALNEQFARIGEDPEARAERWRARTTTPAEVAG